MTRLLSWLTPRPSCPANPEEKALVEDAFLRLETTLGLDRLLQARIIEPTRTFFPDPYEPTIECAERLFHRICRFLGVAPDAVALSFWEEEDEAPQRNATGYYAQVDGVDCVAINAKELDDPEALVATMAHELAHVILLGHLGMDHTEPHMEALTDLATIYLGMGIFTSNTLLRRLGWVEGNLQHWQLSRKGYISPEMAGWALTLFASHRGESNPAWSSHLAADGKAYLKQGLRFLKSAPASATR